jgi:hypothetical protein
VDVLGEFAFTPAFSLPIRLFLEAKFTRNKCHLPVVRNAHGVIHDINENFVHSPGNRLRKRYRYVYALFSTSGFTEVAQDFALAQQISLVDLSGSSFDWLRRGVESAADSLLYAFQDSYQVRAFPVRWMRSQLRQMLGTMPDLPLDEAVPRYRALWPPGVAVNCPGPPIPAWSSALSIPMTSAASHMLVSMLTSMWELARHDRAPAASGSRRCEHGRRSRGW